MSEYRDIVIHSIILNGWPENVVTYADYKALQAEYEALKAKAADDAERLDWIAKNFRTCSLDMGGQHRYAPSAALGQMRGPTFIDAVDTARRTQEKNA